MSVYGTVYYLTQPARGLIKIGYTSQAVRKRARDWARQFETPTYTLAVHPDGDPGTEEEMLQRFHPSLAKSLEWFALSAELEDHIWEMRKKCPPDTWHRFGVHYDDAEIGSTQVAYLFNKTRDVLQYIPSHEKVKVLG